MLNEATLIERVRERATATKHIGNIYDLEETIDDEEVSVLRAKAREWMEQTDSNPPKIDWSDVSPSDDHGDRQSEDDVTAWRRD